MRSTRLAEASFRRWADNSASDSGGGSLRPEARSGSGMSRNKSSTESTPIVASIRARSSGVCGPYAIPNSYQRPTARRTTRSAIPPRSSLACEGLIGRQIKEAIERGWVGYPDPEHPTLTERIAVEKLRLVRQLGIGLDNGPTYGREEITDRLHRLDHTYGRKLGHGPPDLRKVHEDDVTELLGREIGDTHGSQVALNADPLVFFRIAQI